MMGFPDILERLARVATEENGISFIQTYNPTWTSFSSNNGLKQGNVLAALLHNAAFDMTLQQAKCNLTAVIFNTNHTALA